MWFEISDGGHVSLQSTGRLWVKAHEMSIGFLRTTLVGVATLARLWQQLVEGNAVYFVLDKKPA